MSSLTDGIVRVIDQYTGEPISTEYSKAESSQDTQKARQPIRVKAKRRKDCESTQTSQVRPTATVKRNSGGKLRKDRVKELRGILGDRLASNETTECTEYYLLMDYSGEKKIERSLEKIEELPHVFYSELPSSRLGPLAIFALRGYRLEIRINKPKIMAFNKTKVFAAYITLTSVFRRMDNLIYVREFIQRTVHGLPLNNYDMLNTFTNHLRQNTSSRMSIHGTGSLVKGEIIDYVYNKVIDVKDNDISDFIEYACRDSNERAHKS